MKTYAIFKVSNYKGGELSSYINLTKDQFIEELSELFTDDRLYKNIPLSHIEGIIEDLVDLEDFYSPYAGYDEGFTGELYEVRNGIMYEVKVAEYSKEIAKLIYEYNQEG